eukprot:scaffold38456_cov176-Amphora_coffeaeformis.AAC.2
MLIRVFGDGKETLLIAAGQVFYEVVAAGASMSASQRLLRFPFQRRPNASRTVFFRDGACCMNRFCWTLPMRDLI